MKIQTIATNQYSTISKSTLQKANQHTGKVEILQDETVTLKNANGEEVTYNLKPNKNQTNTAIDIKRDMSHLGQRHSPIKSGITLSLGENALEYEFGDFTNKAKIDEYFSMTDRLGVEQQDKMKFMKPSQDWLDIASKLSDEELNEFVDLMYNISESVHFEDRSSKEVELTISKFSNLTSEELGAAIKNMTRLNEQVKSDTSSPNKYRDFGMTVGTGNLFNALRGDVGGDLFRDYSKLIFDSELSPKEIDKINEYITKIDFSATKGLISSATLMRGEPKEQLFNLLSESNNNEVSKVFSYVNDLITKPYHASQYNIEFEDKTKKLTTVLDPELTEHEQNNLIENILAVEKKVGLANAVKLTEQVSSGISQAQKKVWQELAAGIKESSTSLTNKNINTLLFNATEKVETKHIQQLLNSFPLAIEAYGQIKTISNKNWTHSAQS